MIGHITISKISGTLDSHLFCRDFMPFQHILFSLKHCPLPPSMFFGSISGHTSHWSPCTYPCDPTLKASPHVTVSVCSLFVSVLFRCCPPTTVIVWHFLMTFLNEDPNHQPHFSLICHLLPVSACFDLPRPRHTSPIHFMLRSMPRHFIWCMAVCTATSLSFHLPKSALVHPYPATTEGVWCSTSAAYCFCYVF